MNPTEEHTPLAPSIATGDGFERDLSFIQFLWIWNRSQGRETPQLHERIAFWLEHQWRHDVRRLLLTVFRDAGKSTIVGLFCCWVLRRTPDLRILILSAEQGLASKMTRAIRRIIEQHPATGALEPDRAESWTRDQLTVRRLRVQRDPSVLARGIGGNITGTRADLIIFDDVEVPNTSGTTLKREELRDRLREASFVLVPGGGQIYIGTPHTYYSIYAKDVHPEAGEERPFLEGFARLEIPLLGADGASAWPERFPMAAIDQLRSQVGPGKFRSQMMLEPTRADTLRLDPDLLLRHGDEVRVLRGNGSRSVRLAERQIVGSVAAWDPAYARPQSGDGSVIAAMFLDKDGHYWLQALEYLDPHGDPDGLDAATRSCHLALDFARRYDVQALVVESNGIGGFLPGILRRETAGRPGPAIRQRYARIAKDRRILGALDPLMAARRLHVHERVWTTPLIEEMREWRAGGHCRDDGLDAIAACIAELPAQPGLFNAGPTRPGTLPAGFTALTSFDV